MYPKNGTTSGTGKVAARKNFLNPYQREELRKRLTEKFTKLYGLSDPGMVKECVDQFFSNNSEINATNLSKLEGNIKSSSLKSRSLVKPAGPGGHPGAQDEMRSNQAPSDRQEDGKLPQLKATSKQDLNGTNGSRNNQVRNEEDEWAKVSKYNYYMFKQEEQLAQMRRANKMVSMRNQLDDQIREKDRIKMMERQQEDSYIRTEAKVREIEANKDGAKQKLHREKVKFEKEMRDRQMKEISQRKDFEISQEKTLDSYILSKIKEELAREQQKQAVDKQVKQEEMKKVMLENEARKKKLLDIQANERQEDIELQQKAIKLAEELEAQRAKDLKTRSDRIQALISVSEDKVKDIANKNLEMDMRNKRYQELRERCLQEKTRKEDEKERNRKVLLKQFLDKQVEEKKKNLTSEKNRMNEQADLWRTDADKFKDFSDHREGEKNRIMGNYKQNLIEQMEIRKNKDKKWRCDMNPNEREMNNELLAQINSIDLQKLDAPNPYEISDNVF